MNIFKPFAHKNALLLFVNSSIVKIKPNKNYKTMTNLGFVLEFEYDWVCFNLCACLLKMVNQLSDAVKKLLKEKDVHAAEIKKMKGWF